MSKFFFLQLATIGARSAVQGSDQLFLHYIHTISIYLYVYSLYQLYICTYTDKRDPTVHFPYSV